MKWSMQRDMSERQFLEALKRHGMKFETEGYINLGIPGNNLWDKPPDGKRRAKLAYLLASKERWSAKLEAERANDLDPDSELMYRSLPRGEDR
jgi:hypothetical protein